MGVEIEAKMKLDDPSAVLRVLAGSGCPAPVEHMEINTFLDTPDRSLTSSDQGLRIRTDRLLASGREDVIITYKGPRQPGPFKTRQEVELHAASDTDAAALLACLGYRQTLRFEKHRTAYAFMGCAIDIDRLPLLGNFIEIEGPDEPSVQAARNALGLADLPLISDSYATLLNRYLEQNRIPSRNIRLSAL
jgi:adenylate cyclase class 2